MNTPILNMNNPETTHDSPEARGARLKKVRKMLGMTAEELSQLIGYTRQTISYWENAIEGGLSQKGAAKLVEVARQRGVLCDLPWLLYGLGELKVPPSRTPYESSPILADQWIAEGHQQLRYHLKFFKEIETFLSEYPDAVVVEVKDTAMHPLYEKGDWVGGHPAAVDEKLIGKVCIVEINGKSQIRLIQAGGSYNKFNMTFINKDVKTNDTFELKDVEIIKAAPITRLWRR